MAITLGTFTTYTALTGGSYTVPAGTNRKAILSVGFSCNNGATPSSVTATLGGVSFTAVTGSPVTTDGLGGGNAQNNYSFFMDDASLPATGSQSLVVTITGGTGVEGYRIALAIHSGCAQGQPTYAEVARTTEGSGTDSVVVPVSPGTFAVAEGSVAVLSVMDDRLPTYSGGTGYTQRYNFVGDLAATTAYGTSKAFTGVSTGNAVATKDIASWWAGAVVVLDPATSGPTINTQPQAQTAILAGSYADTSATFSVSATTSGGTLHYAWTFNSISVGTDSSSYTRTGIVSGDNGHVAQVTVTDDNGSTLSSTAALTVDAGDTVANTSGTTSSGTLSPETTIKSDLATAGKELVRLTRVAAGITIGTHVVTKA